MRSHASDLDRVFHALADPSRRAMLERLGTGAASVGELARPLAMSLAAVMQHLQVLEDGGLVRSRKSGRVRSCELDREGLSAAYRWLGEREHGRPGAHLDGPIEAAPPTAKPGPRKRRPA